MVCHLPLLVKMTTSVAQVRSQLGGSNLFRRGVSPLVQGTSPAEGFRFVETLKDLLERAKLKRQVNSGRALAALAEQQGFSDYRTQINQILSGTYKSRPTNAL